MALAARVREASFAWNVLRRRPFQVFLQVTNRCNMRCGFCDFWPNGVSPDQELTVEDYRKLSDELAKLGTFLVSIEGGEPFVRPDIIEIVRAFAGRHLPVLYTNGWYVGHREAEALAAAGIANVGVSIDYATAERHDRNRGLDGAWERAWNAADCLRDSLPHAGRQVHIMTVLMRDNIDELEALLEMGAARKIGHCITLLSVSGFRRGADAGEWPETPVSERLLRLWKKHKHFRIFRRYLELMDPFLRRGPMPECRAGFQSFNIDHVGNVAPCIEKIDMIVGNVRKDSLDEIRERLRKLDAGHGCQQCWTACRGFNQVMGDGGSWSGWKDMAVRMRSS